MAVFSKIISLAVLLAAAAVTTEATLERPLARAITVRHHPARAAHVSPVKGTLAKRGAGRKKRCAAKTTSSVQPESTTKTTTKASSTTTTKAAATTTKASTGSSSSGGSDGSSKAGLGWNDGKNVDIGQYTGSGSRVSWCYSWSPWSCANSKIDFVPMLWGSKQIDDFNNQYNKNNPKYILSFNEPDLGEQANLSPGAAVDLWYQQLDWRDAKKIAPAPSGGDGGRKWLTQFMAACSGCDIHALGIHYYSVDADALIKYVKSVHDEFPDFKIWVTEWACHTFPNNKCSASEASAFNQKVMQFFESADYVEHYAAFGSLTDMYNVGDGARLMTAGGVINDLGSQYAYGGLY